MRGCTEKLEEAVSDAELHAEMDAAGMLDLLEDLKSKAKGSETAEADALKKSQQEPNNEEQVQVAEELEALSPGSADTDEILATLGVSSEEEGDEEGEDDNESQEEENEGAEEETEDEAASDPEDDDDKKMEKGMLMKMKQKEAMNMMVVKKPTVKTAALPKLRRPKLRR